MDVVCKRLNDRKVDMNSANRLRYGSSQVER
jgi:hypothetical protein